MSQDSPAVPFGYCHCGCGVLAPIASATIAKRNIWKGQPFRYIAGHQRRGTGRTAIDRFTEKYRIDTATGCWLWTAAPYGHNRYGAFAIGRNAQGCAKVAAAHRWSYQHHVGPIPDGLYVLHSCDTPLCVNPEHLSLGTQADNIADMLAKGRGRHQKH